MGNIKELYENINFLTYPKVISDALTRFGHKKDSLGNKCLPEFIEISYPKFSYYILFQHYNRQQHTTFKDINGNTLKGKELTSLYKEYAKGFNDAYNEYENKINNNKSIFTKTDEFFAEKIYSNVFNGSNGSIAGIGGKSINGKGYLYYTKENFYKGGFNGGEFYKGIEIILNNPVVFEPVFKRHKNSQKTNNIKQTETIDLSNTKGTEKVIMLKQLGILDFLKEKQPFNLSTNALASALSGITGIDTKTLQSYINPIDNPSVNQKNNPLKSEKSVNKVSQKLISIGYTPPK